MDQANKVASITLSGAPEACTPKIIKNQLVEFLGKKGCVNTIKRFKKPDGSKVDGKFVVSLERAEDVERLIAEVEIDLEFEDDLYSLKITKSRPSVSLSAQQSPSHEKSVSPRPSPRHGVPVDEKNKGVSPRPSPRHGVPVDEKNKDRGSFSGFESSDDGSISPLEDDVTTEFSDSSGNEDEKSFSPKLEVAKLPKKPLDWFGLLQKSPDIFEKYTNRCILVQEAPKNVNIAELNTHFQNRIRKVELLADGILVAFGNERDVHNAIRKREHAIGNTVLNVYKKPVPPVYDDRILIKGNFTQSSRDDIANILESCTELEFEVQKQHSSGMFLAVFEESIDITGFKHQLKELSLTEMNPQFLEVCRSDCIKLQNVKKGATVAKIKIAFMNKRLHDGNVTLVTQDESTNTALVYFADYKDAEKIAELSKGQEIKVAKQAVEVSIFCPGIKGSVEILPFNIHQFTYQLNVDPDVIDFIQNSPDLKRDFDKEIGHLAAIEFVHDSSSARYDANIKPLLSAKESKEMEQENFENECRRRIQRFCDKCQVKTQKFGDEDRKRVRKDFRWTRDAQIIEVKVKDNESINVFVRWEDREFNAVKVISAAEKAQAFLDFFEEKCNLIEVTDAYEDYEFQILEDCGIVEDTKHFFPDDVRIDVDKAKRTVTYKGSKENVFPAQNAVKNNLKKTVECDLTFLATLQLKFLLDTVSASLASTSPNKIDVIEYLREQLKQNKIKVHIVAKGDTVKLVYCHNKSDEIEKAQVKILALIKSQAIDCPNGFDELMKEDQWKNLQEDIESSGTLVIFKNHRASAVQLVGLPKNFEKASTHITEYFKQNIEIEDKVELPYAQTMFMTEYPGKSGVSHGLTDVEYYKESGGIHLKGKARLVKKARTWVSQAVSGIQTDKKTMKVPGMADYLRDKGGEQFLKNTSQETRCVIQIDSMESGEWNEAAKDKGSIPVDANVKEQVPSFQSENKPSLFQSATKGMKRLFGMKTSHTETNLTPQEDASVDVTVINGDILTSDCDVIINTVGPKYDLSASQLSAKLLAKAGQEMADECEKNPISVVPGMFKITSAPNLPFKAIIHFITPDTADKIGPILKVAFNELETQLKIKSLAIPAVGTGQLGFSSHDVAKTIREAISDFKTTGPMNLTRIDVVVFDRNMINDFKQALSKSQLTVQSRARSTATPPSSASTSQSTLPIQVTVKSGDILTSNCEAMVNTIGSDLDLSKSQLSSKVIKKGGNIIDKECKGTQQYKSSNYRISSGGKMKFRNIIHFVTPDNPQALSNGLEEVFALVNDNLQLSSLAIPAIGAGNANLPTPNVAQAFDIALSNFYQTNPKVLKRIDIVIFDQTLISLFQNQISNANPTSSSSSFTRRATSKTNPLSNVPSRMAINARHAVDVYLTSNSSASRQTAWNKICDKAKSKCDKRSIEDDVLETLDEDDLDEIMALEAMHNVTITRPDDSSKTNTLLILGIKSKVKDAHTDAITLLHKYSTAMTYSEYVDWKFYHSHLNNWESFSRLTNTHLEKMYRENQNARITVDTKIKGKLVRISVDFKKMTMKRLDNQATHRIKQCFISNADETYPNNWNNSKAVQLVSLDNGSKEYSNVLGKIQATQKDVQMNVVRIDRVENKRLYAQFKAQKEEVKERMRKAGTKHPVTRELFHGTSSDTYAQIYKSGFDRGFAGKNATLYGIGVYFAVNSKYSHGYTQPNNQGERKMFLADVVTGEFCEGKSNYKVPPVRLGGQPSDLYDSVVNDENNPTIFVVFKDASVYPLYIITYT